MFKKYKFVRRSIRLMRACGGNIDHPSKADAIVISVIMFPMHDDRNRKELPFNNKFVLADAAILGMIYAIANSGADYANNPDFIKECMTKMYSGICEMYHVEQKALLDIVQNRTGFFEPILRNGNVNRFLNEAVILFSQDIMYNKFVPFAEDSPLPILDIQEQMQIDIRTRAHFAGLLPILERQ